MSNKWKPSEHFTYDEVVTTSHPIKNEPSPAEMMEAKRLADTILEPWRELIGRLHINSWFRCPKLNDAVAGGTNVPSAHLDGRAADVVPLDTKLVDALHALIHSDIPFDKVIYETNLRGASWIHVQLRGQGGQNRHLVLRAIQQPDGVYIYSTYKEG